MKKNLIRFKRNAEIPGPEQTEPKLLGECIAQHRSDIELTQARVVEIMDTGHSAGWLSMIENGHFVRPPRWADWRALCRAVHANPVELLVGCGYITQREVMAFAHKREQVAARR